MFNMAQLLGSWVTAAMRAPPAVLSATDGERGRAAARGPDGVSDVTRSRVRRVRILRPSRRTANRVT
jgi:hypothetical protein